MTKYEINLSSKNKLSLAHFLQLLKRQGIKTRNFQILLKAHKSKKSKKKITVLKSPHVNKKAQEHFESITYTVKITCLSWEIPKNLILLKKIKNRLFPEIKIRIKNFSNKKLFKSNFFNPAKTLFYDITNIWSIKQNKSNLTLDNIREREKLRNKTVAYLKILGNYGHLN